MIKEAIEKIICLAAPNKVEFGGHTYYDRSLSLLEPPEVKAVSVTTLQGLSDLYSNDLDLVKSGEVFVHITSPTSVEIVSQKSDDYGRRHLWAKAQHPGDVQRFSFGGFLNTENFIIGLQSCFQRTYVERPDGKVIGDLEYVLKVASNVSSEGKVTQADDGISQNVEMAKGIVLKEQATLRSRVQLAPFRTFAEIDQPLSTFVLRVREQNGSIQLALFEADGGRWKLDAVSSLSKWLKAHFKVPIIS